MKKISAKNLRVKMLKPDKIKNNTTSIKKT